ncbi:uncharacterized protein LOC135700013 [Ochlerotatus camptorhynchus]|uniref:uncharacterized protein LOC135700013 n=1 Tax=Ochlerotatus camptorhynchus TaxID=644619 RepID=UPI0031E222D6
MSSYQSPTDHSVHGATSVDIYSLPTKSQTFKANKSTAARSHIPWKMEPLTAKLTFLLLVLATSILFPHPASSSSCSAGDLTTVQSVLLTSVNAGDPLQPSETALKRCPALTNITETLRLMVSGMRQVEQAGICSDRVRKLREAFKQKINKVVTIKTIASLPAQVDKLRAEMMEATRELYEDAVASVVKLLWINQAFSVRSFSKHKLVSPLNKLSPDYRLYLNSLQYLNRTKNEAMVGSVFDAILSRLNKLDVGIRRRMETGRNDLVTLLCWTVNNGLLGEKYIEKKGDILRLALQFYPKDGDTKSYQADIQRRKTCPERFPDTVIRGMALGLRDVK